MTLTSLFCEGSDKGKLVRAFTRTRVRLCHVHNKAKLVQVPCLVVSVRVINRYERNLLAKNATRAVERLKILADEANGTNPRVCSMLWYTTDICFKNMEPDVKKNPENDCGYLGKILNSLNCLKNRGCLFNFVSS